MLPSSFTALIFRLEGNWNFKVTSHGEGLRMGFDDGLNFHEISSASIIWFVWPPRFGDSTSAVVNGGNVARIWYFGGRLSVAFSFVIPIELIAYCKQISNIYEMVCSGVSPGSFSNEICDNFINKFIGAKNKHWNSTRQTCNMIKCKQFLAGWIAPT